VICTVPSGFAPIGGLGAMFVIATRRPVPGTPAGPVGGELHETVQEGTGARRAKVTAVVPSCDGKAAVARTEEKSLIGGRRHGFVTVSVCARARGGGGAKRLDRANARLSGGGGGHGRR